jgi:PAS domain S-box-containing protein
MEIAQDAINKHLESLDIKEDLYSAVIQNALEGFVILSLEGDILNTNEAFSRMNGYSRDELLSMRVYDLSPQQMTADSYAQFIKDHIKQGGANFETCHKCKDGRIIDVKVSSKYLNVNGGIFFSFHSDITEQKKRDRQTERSLKEVEDRYRAIIELGTKIGEAIVMLQDIDGREGMHTYVSDQWPAFTGYLREELLAMSFFDLVKPEDKEASIQRHRQKMSGEAIPNLVELTIIHKDGHEVPVELTSAGTIYNKKPVNMMYIRDITERKKTESELKKSEEKYRFFFENTPIAIFECDYSNLKPLLDELRCRGVTDFKDFFKNNHDIYLKACKLQKTARLNIAGLKLYEAENEGLIRSEFSQYPEIQNYALKIMAGLAERKMNFIIDEVVTTLKGNRRYLRAFVSVAKGCEQTYKIVYISHLDITELKQAEEKLTAHQKHLEEEIKDRTVKLRSQIQQRIEYTRLLVHELRTPLTPLLGASELLARELKDERLIDTAKAVYNGALKLEKRVSELLDQARLETGSLELKREITDANKLLNEVVEYVKPRLTKKSQNITLDIMTPLPLLFADGERLNQIVLNLVDNSFKNTPIGGKIIIRAYKDHGYLVFEIEDNGYGITKKNQKGLFKPYSQAHNNGDNMGGLGLGLFLCKSLVELHGGEIWVNSKKGRGSVFSFSIPTSSSIK